MKQNKRKTSTHTNCFEIKSKETSTKRRNKCVYSDDYISMITPKMTKTFDIN